jgi:RimJ/RimL family protein N-acetyltransferase
MRVLETDRLDLRELEPRDAAFVLELVNDPAWLRYIGDRGIRTLDDAGNYILKGPRDMYARLGFGLWLAATKSGEAVGMCGLLRREGLDDVDIGFAFLAAHRRMGYAYEAAAAVLGYAKHVLKLPRVVAITAPDNDISARLLGKLGFRFERVLALPDAKEVRLFTT